jgi:ABC-type nitrate/sulfonate/bicarbonate transport system substrate-binding protein
MMQVFLSLSIVLLLTFLAGDDAIAQGRKVRVALPGHTITSAPLLTAKMNGYYAQEGLDAKLVSMRAPTANLAVLAGNVEFSNVPMVGLNAA